MDLLQYFENNQGPMIHKWAHYFEIYERHFQAFRNRPITMLEIGVFQGGSVKMWKEYFGPQARIVGIDINPACKKFEEENVDIMIGSQEDKQFLAEVKAKYPQIDIILDDGGHTMNQQIVTFNEMFPHLAEGGVYLCEDLHTSYWSAWGGGYRSPGSFIEQSKQIIDSMNAWHSRDPESFRPNYLTQHVYGMHYYDSVLVIEKRKRTPPVDKRTGIVTI